MATISLLSFNIYSSGSNIEVVQSNNDVYIGFTGTGLASNTGQLTGEFYPLNSNPALYVTAGQTGDFVVNSQLSSYALKSETGNFVTKSDTGVLATKSYVDAVSGALAGQGGGSGTIVKVTGSANLTTANITGIGSTKVILSGNSVLISGSAAEISGVTLVGGATILDGQLLIGASGDNSFTQGGITAGSGINIISGSGSLTINSTSPVLDIRTKSSNYTVTTSDLVFNPLTLVYTGSSVGTFTLPAASQTSGKVVIAKHGGVGNLIVTGSSSNAIYFTGLVSSITISGGDTLAFHSDSVKYWAH